jgi:hypothetical protein
LVKVGLHARLRFGQAAQVGVDFVDPFRHNIDVLIFDQCKNGIVLREVISDRRELLFVSDVGFLELFDLLGENEVVALALLGFRVEIADDFGFRGFD